MKETVTFKFRFLRFRGNFCYSKRDSNIQDFCNKKQHVFVKSAHKLLYEQGTARLSFLDKIVNDIIYFIRTVTNIIEKYPIKEILF